MSRVVERAAPVVLHPAIVAAIAVLGLPLVFNTYWLEVFTTAAVYSVAALGLSLLYGRAGLISLGQIAMLAIGGWVAMRIGQATDLPFAVLLVVTGLITGAIGVVLGLPALRLSGLYLALITLMFAASVTILLYTINFPNGGSDFFGYDPALTSTVPLERPGFATSNTAYFRYVVVTVAVIFVLVMAHAASVPGRAWAAVRQSEFAALAAGVNVTLYKLWAFALASFVTGVAGALLAASSGGLTVYQFPPQESIVLAAAVLMAGVYDFAGAVVAGILVKVLPAVLNLWEISPNVLLGLFGVGLIQTILASPTGMVGQFRSDIGRLTTRARRSTGGTSGRTAGGPAGGTAMPS